ncbi:MAG: phosphoserine phosphatase SerB [Hyphomonadaceae bacterium]|nr:MAG: phosphoserine phosphatase [Caulobacteraceae bacterium]MBT9444598.1 phosphoserine phosphatase SerB [Hyphomonadaceae bacterium]TPW03941.1 MAG: phosphoserine phosphatase [Alphaproteobacteria bacterium]
MNSVLVVVAPEAALYRDALMTLGSVIGIYGATPPKVLSPWEACEWTLPEADEGARDVIEQAMDGIDADWALLPAEGRRKTLLVADMDSTIIGCECIDELADFAGRKAEISAITERAMRGELDFEAALTERVAMLKGLPLSALQQCFDDRVRLNPGARTLVQTMRAHGARCALVSGGFTFFTSRVAQLAGFDVERANTLIDDGAALAGAVGQPILGREAKLAALMEESANAPAAAIALGDGANDLAMIKAAGLGVAYRAKPIVAAEAGAKIDFTTLETALFYQGYRRAEFSAS